MSRLPTQSIFGNGVPVPDQTLPTPDTGGGALGGIGRGLTTLGKTLTELEKKKQQAEDAGNINDAYSETRRLVQGLAADPATNVESFDKATDEFVANRVKSARSPRQAEAIRSTMLGIIDSKRASVVTAGAAKLASNNRAGVLQETIDLEDSIRSGNETLSSIDKREAQLNSLLDNHVGVSYNDEQELIARRRISETARLGKIGILNDELSIFVESHRDTWRTIDGTDKGIVVDEIRSLYDDIVSLDGMSKTEANTNFDKAITLLDNSAFQQHMDEDPSGAVIALQGGNYDTLGLPGHKDDLMQRASRSHENSVRFSRLHDKAVNDTVQQRYADFNKRMPALQDSYKVADNDQGETIIENLRNEIFGIADRFEDVTEEDAQKTFDSALEALAITRADYLSRTDPDNAVDIMKDPANMPSVQGDLRERVIKVARSGARAEFSDRELAGRSVETRIDNFIIDANGDGSFDAADRDAAMEIVSSELKSKDPQTSKSRFNAKASIQKAYHQSNATDTLLQIERARAELDPKLLPDVGAIKTAIKNSDISKEQGGSLISRINEVRRVVNQRVSARNLIQQSIVNGDIIPFDSTATAVNDAYNVLATTTQQAALVRQAGNLNIPLPKAYYQELDDAAGLGDSKTYNPARLKELVGYLDNDILRNNIASSNPIFATAVWHPELLDQLSNNIFTGKLLDSSATLDSLNDKKSATLFEESVLLDRWWPASNLSVDDIDGKGTFSNQLHYEAALVMAQEGLGVGDAVLKAHKNLEKQYVYPTVGGDKQYAVSSKSGFTNDHAKNRKPLQEDESIQYDAGFEKDGFYFTPVTTEMGGVEIITSYLMNSISGKSMILTPSSQTIPPFSHLIGTDGSEVRVSWLIRGKKQEEIYLEKANDKRFSQLQRYADRVFENTTGHPPDESSPDTPDAQDRDAIMDFVARKHGWAGAFAPRVR